MSFYICIGDVKVTDEWFVPLETGRKWVREQLVFLKYWKKYMERTGDYGGGPWHHRIEEIIFVPRGGTTEASRIATTFFLYFGSNSGHCFFAHFLLKGMKNEDTFSGCCEQRAVAAWAIENSRSSLNGGRRALEGILNRDITFLDLEIAEEVVKWATSKEGRKLLAMISQELKWNITWEIPDIQIEGFEEETTP